jgi:hypothetical protein
MLAPEAQAGGSVSGGGGHGGMAGMPASSTTTISLCCSNCSAHPGRPGGSRLLGFGSDWRRRYAGPVGPIITAGTDERVVGCSKRGQHRADRHRSRSVAITCGNSCSRAPGCHRRPAAHGTTDEDTVNLVGMLFDYILNDRNRDSDEGIVGRLQIPMLKVAILDKTFFNRTSHPLASY